MKIAYLILGHDLPEQIIRTIEALSPTASAFVVHIDQRAKPNVMCALEHYAWTSKNLYFARRCRCSWGGYGIMQGTFECIRTLLAQSPEFDYATLISGQDYPIKSPGHIAAFLEKNRGSEFIEAFSLRRPNRWTTHEGAYQAMARVVHWHFSYGIRKFHLPLKRRFYRDWEPFGGSQWWCLSSAAIVWIAQYIRENPSLGRYFRFVNIPDESMIQSMMANSPFRDKLAAKPVHYVDWGRPNPKIPRTLDEEDFDRVAASPELFARKVHPERSRALLDRIDRELLVKS